MAAGTSETLDLTLCDREPIQIPGSIQPHGMLLALDGEGAIRVVSENAPLFLGTPVEQLYGRTLDELLGTSLCEALRADLGEDDGRNLQRMLPECHLPAAAGTAQGENGFCDVVAYRAAHPGGELQCFEFEPVGAPVDIAKINARLHNFVATIRRMATPEAVCEAAVLEISEITQCDRILLYRFDDEGNGIVLAEHRAGPQFSSYLDLRFPASDIPKQARRLYEVNRIRIIPDVDYQAAILLSASGPETQLDLTGSMLRSVSPVHRQYMRNMGTVCSMSVSLMIEGRLWGLISCHHRVAKYLPLRLRSACDFIAQITASQLEAQQSSLTLRAALRAKSQQNHLLARMAAAENYIEGLRSDPGVLAELTGAAGVVIISGTGVTAWGTTPSEEYVRELASWLREHHGDELFVTDSLSSVLPSAERYAAHGSGVIATSLSKLNSTQVIWFRPELVHTVRWAGNPQKPAFEPAGAEELHLLSPRGSFEDWSEVVRRRAEPWGVHALDAARDFRAAILEIVLRRAEELAAMAGDLRIVNEELEAFSYSVSHDLRAPFRHISGFSEMLKEHEAESMSERGKYYLATIMDSAQFAGQLVDSLLEFARVGRLSMHMSQCAMDRIVDSEWRSILSDRGTERRVEFSRGDLPTVNGDPNLLRQVWRNLLENALKYSARREAARVHVACMRRGDDYIFSVADNGVGFDQQYAGKLFGVFQRLHRIEDFEGTGIGLANVRRIVGRHGGRVWAEGVQDVGATFFFSLPVRSSPSEGNEE